MAAEAPADGCSGCVEWNRARLRRCDAAAPRSGSASAVCRVPPQRFSVGAADGVARSVEVAQKWARFGVVVSMGRARVVGRSGGGEGVGGGLWRVEGDRLITDVLTSGFLSPLEEAR